MPAGRPTAYEDTYPERVELHLSQGFTLASWAGDVGVSRETVYNWSEKYPEFLDAIKVGRSKGMLVWERRLADQALKGEGNTAAIIFAMKNLYRDDWADKVVNEHSHSLSDPLTQLLTDVASSGKRLVDPDKP